MSEGRGATGVSSGNAEGVDEGKAAVDDGTVEAEVGLAVASLLV